MNLESIEMRMRISLKVNQDMMAKAIKEKEETIHLKDFYGVEIKKHEAVIRELNWLLDGKD